MAVIGERHTLDGVHGVGGGRGGREASSRLTALEDWGVLGPIDPLTGNVTIGRLSQGLRRGLGRVVEGGEAVERGWILGQSCLQLSRLVWLCPGAREGGGLRQNTDLVIKVLHDLIQHVQVLLKVLLRVRMRLGLWRHAARVCHYLQVPTVTL